MSHHPRILTVTQWAGGANWSMELQHSCTDHTLIWQTRGQGRCVIEGIRRGFGVHTALAIPAGTPFSIEINKQTFGLVCLVPAQGPLLMPDTPTLLRIREVQAQAELTGILEAMQREQNNKRPFMDEGLNAQGALLTIWLRRAMIAEESSPPKLSAAERLVRAYAALIERDYTTGRPMADYAQTLGVTPTHLTRTCRHCAGLTASDLLTQRSLHAARTFLERGDQPIAQIAARLGFNSAGYFSRFVQHHTGLTPSALRKRARSEPHANVA
ncbi:helix-turn-helix domain-containing protein [Roseovarius sp. 2305UL8-3]|uniref:helix-turn-helix domain-containing protein n=1 Tax=Roseovarius conchicola TaxID=3121636 RepID=UPI003527B844